MDYDTVCLALFLVIGIGATLHTVALKWKIDLHNSFVSSRAEIDKWLREHPHQSHDDVRLSVLISRHSLLAKCAARHGWASEEYYKSIYAFSQRQSLAIPPWPY